MSGWGFKGPEKTRWRYEVQTPAYIPMDEGFKAVCPLCLCVVGQIGRTENSNRILFHCNGCAAFFHVNNMAPVGLGARKSGTRGPLSTSDEQNPFNETSKED